MSIDTLRKLTEGTVLEGPHWTEPVKVLTAKIRGNRIEVQAVGTLTKRLWTKLLKPEEFGDTIKVTEAGQLAALDGNPTHFRLAAEAHRIRLAFQYDPHFAVSVSQVDPLPHQMDAVYSHLLTQPRIRFLIADDPGAGKTIMAGLTIKELKFRGLIERTLIVTPANLTDQWRRELHDKFGETFTVINRGTVGAAYGRNVWEDSPQCIASVDFVARQDDVLNMIRDVHWDLCIVDEAHKMAAYRYGTKVNKTQRYILGEFLREHTDHYLFLTATPHKGDPDNFALLLQLLDQDLYVNGQILAEASAHDENRIMVRRLKEDMRKFDGSPCFPPRHVQTLPYKLSNDELKLYDAVTDYVQQNFQRAEAAENRNVGLALTVLQRRMASSLAAIRLSLERRRKRLKDLQKLGRLKQEYGELPEDLDDLTEAERWQFEDDIVERLTMAENMAELEAEIEELDRLVQLARHTEKHVTETKFEELRSVIANHISGRAERLLVFTEHKDTLDFLVGKLTNLGFHCCTIHGGMPLEKRIDAEREFFEHKPSVLIATEAAGEGINLQFCSLMVNYDIPWNPNRLEQRMGRIHRYKQDYGHSLRQGAVFYNADATEPTVLWLLKCGVEDGRGQMVGERLFAIHRTLNTYRKSQPYALLDLKPAEGGVVCPAPVRQAATDEDQIIDWSLAEVTPSYFGEIEARRQAELGIKEKYVRKSLQFLMGESVKKIAAFDKQLREIRDEGDPRRLNIAGNRAKEDARRNELSQRLKDRLAEIEQEQHLSEKPPEILGVAVILPVPGEVVRSVEGMESDPEVERIAVEVTMRHERDAGRKPVSVEEENCGWDVTSLCEGQVERYIEVKGRACVGGVALTPNEWIKAQRFGPDYWLYIVTDCRGEPQLHLIQDPAARLNPKEEISVVRYLVSQGDWQNAEAAGR